MTLLQAILLGIVQGLTEFLPVSSSGHLVLVPYLFGWQIPADQAFVFNVLVQIGTLVAVFVYFWGDLFEIARTFLAALARRQPAHPEARMGWLILIATIPAATFGLAFKSAVEAAFQSVTATGLFLLFTAGLLVAAERIGKRQRSMAQMTWRDALVVGLFQLLALFPGVSRSGSTITGGMARHLERGEAARFSFLIAVPIMLGAGLNSLVDLFRLPDVSAFLAPMLAGFVASAVVGYLSIRWLLGFLKRSPLYVFALYVGVVGGGTLVSVLI